MALVVQPGVINQCKRRGWNAMTNITEICNLWCHLRRVTASSLIHADLTFFSSFKWSRKHRLSQMRHVCHDSFAKSVSNSLCHILFLSVLQHSHLNNAYQQFLEYFEVPPPGYFHAGYFMRKMKRFNGNSLLLSTKGAEKSSVHCVRLCYSHMSSFLVILMIKCLTDILFRQYTDQVTSISL